jgi:hypothetical protein
MKAKFYFVMLLIFSASTLVAQDIRILDSNEYDQLKKTNQLPEKFMLKKTEGSQTVLLPRIQPPLNSIQSNTTCNCLLPLDSSYSIVPFTNGTAPEYRNDDGSSPLISIPFSYCFFGQTMTELYINNNGNISFGTPYGTFSAFPFPDPSYVMVAPFWADVDTRNVGSGLVYYKVTPTSLIIVWSNVGYYPEYIDKISTFQLIISDGTDPLIPGGSNTAFCYGDMQWTTGDASGGGGTGFGGTPATVGANFGDGLNFIQFGRYDQPGYSYDGGGGASDGVDWLDSSGFVFNLCPFNIPPIALDCNSDTVLLHANDTTDLDFSFIAAEIGQNVNITINTGGLNITTLNNTSGNLAHYTGQLITDNSNIGTNNFSITATDDGSPAQSTTVNRVFQVDEALGIHQNNSSSFISFSPNPFTDQTVLAVSGMHSESVSLLVTDIMGHEVLKADRISSSYIIEKGNLGRGIYFYHVTDGNSVNEKGKLIIQ